MTIEIRLIERERLADLLGPINTAFGAAPSPERVESLGKGWTAEEAVAIAQQCPGLPYGAKVEVRQIIQHCAEANEAEFKKALITKNLGRSPANEKEIATANA